MQLKCQSTLTNISKLVSKTADGFYYPLLPLAAFFAGSIHSGALLVTLALGFIIERPLYFVLKNTLKRNRPAQAMPGFSSFIVPSDQFSFPSGHTSGAFLTASITSVFYPALTIPLYCWAFLTGTSRVFIGVHFPTDILAGAVIGCAIGSLVTGAMG